MARALGLRVAQLSTTPAWHPSGVNLAWLILWALKLALSAAWHGHLCHTSVCGHIAVRALSSLRAQLGTAIACLTSGVGTAWPVFQARLGGRLRLRVYPRSSNGPAEFLRHDRLRHVFPRGVLLLSCRGQPPVPFPARFSVDEACIWQPAYHAFRLAAPLPSSISMAMTPCSLRL